MNQKIDFPIRINKYLAYKGVSSRREADALIVDGKVTVNGKKAMIGQQITEKDDVAITGKSTHKKYYAFYKGRNIITHSPTEDEIDVSMKLQEAGIEDVYPVGRLDKQSEGLIIVTNDGRITGPLLDPESGCEKEYDVIVDKPITGVFLKQMAKGVHIERYTTKPTKVSKHPKNNKRFTIILTEGKKHQIRRMCAALGYQVQSLKRTRILNVELGKLKPNQHRVIKDKELKTFLTSLHIS